MTDNNKDLAEIATRISYGKVVDSEEVKELKAEINALKRKNDILQYYAENFHDRLYAAIGRALDTTPDGRQYLADHKALIDACDLLIDYRRRIDPLYFQLEKIDDYIRMITIALATLKGKES